MASHSDSVQVELVRNGEVRFSLYRLPWQSAEDILRPADELVRYLERSLGQRIPTGPIMEENPHPVALVLHRDVYASLGSEAFEVEAAPERIVLRARTVQAMFHAVYWFLETALGVRWLWPGESGEVVPEHRDLAFPVGTYREAPDYAWRAIDLGGACYQAMDINTMLHAVLGLPLSYLDEFQAWCRRNRFGGVKVAGGHRWAEIAPPEVYGETHPEYYALVAGERDCKPGDGKHGNQPCLSNPDVMQMVADYACASFEAQPDLNVISVALNDSGKACECPDCRAIDEAAGASGVRSIEHFDRVTDESAGSSAAPGSITDQLFWFMQGVAERVRERFPDRLLLSHLYSYYRRPPLKYDLPSEVLGQYCVMGPMFWDDDARSTEYGRIREMGRHAPTLGIYEYYSNGAWPEVHRLIPELVADTVRNYHEAGARYFATQPGTGFAANGLNFFVLGRCLWDVGADPDAAVDDFCRSGFGPAADAIRGYLDAFAQQWRDTRSGTLVMADVDRYTGFAGLYPEEFLDQRQEELASAESLTARDPEILRRIEFLQTGLDYTRLYCDACRATIPVLKVAGVSDPVGIDLSRLSSEDRSTARDLSRKAVGAWDAYWGFVRKHMGQYVFGEFWVNYRPGTFGAADRGLKKLRELAEETA